MGDQSTPVRSGFCALTVSTARRGFGQENVAQYPASKAVAHDSESGRVGAALKTGPDFGCVQWELRPE